MNASPDPASRARRRRNLKRLVNARSIAFIGGDMAAGGIAYCRAVGFSGDIWAVNPNRTALEGVPCAPSVDDLPGVPDASWVAVSAERAIDAIARLNAMGSPSAVVYTAGFSETGDGALERRLVEAAGDMAVVGPNCMGVVNYLDGVPVALTPDLGTERPEHGVALVAQSGTMIGNMVNSGRSLPVSHLFSMGNQAVTEIADAIDVLADDARVDAILLYVEGLRDAGAFARAAARAFDRGKTIVAMKAGASETGRDVAMSHTGSLAGPPELYDALFDRLGIVKVETFPELLEMSKLFAFDGAPRGNRLMVETCSGTDSGYCADLAERHGVVLPKLDGEAREAVERVIPAIATPANPLDVTMEQWGDREAQATSLIALLRQPSDAAALVINLPLRGETSSFDPAIEAMLDVKAATDLPCYVITNLPEGAPERVRKLLFAHGVIPLQGMEDAMSCIGRAARYAAERERLRAAGGPDVRLLNGRAPGAATLLDEAESKARLRSRGVAVPSSELCGGPGEAVAAAERLGYPVVLKGRGAGLAHKSELGAVAVNLGDAAAVRRAADAVGRAPGADALLVEEMVTDGVAETIVGVTRDPTLGLGLVVGMGGVLAELLRDRATLLLPTRREAVEDAVAGLRGYPLLTGYRGRPAGDVAALTETVMAVARFAEDHAESLVELDLNPVVVRPAGKGAVAVDALLRIAEPSA